MAGWVYQSSMTSVGAKIGLLTFSHFGRQPRRHSIFVREPRRGFTVRSWPDDIFRSEEVQDFEDELAQ